MNWIVYILKSVNKNWYYVGSTNSIERRLKEHQSGKSKSTKPYLPIELVFRKEFLTEREARGYERKLKQKRVEKETIIRQIKDV
jgi:putative endonuclease